MQDITSNEIGKVTKKKGNATFFLFFIYTLFTTILFVNRFNPLSYDLEVVLFLAVLFFSVIYDTNIYLAAIFFGISLNAVIGSSFLVLLPNFLIITQVIIFFIQLSKKNFAFIISPNFRIYIFWFFYSVIVGFVFIENPMQLIYFNQNYLAILCSIMIILLIDRDKAKYFLENSLMAACAIGAIWYFSLFLLGWDVTERYTNQIILPDRNYASLFFSFGVAVTINRFQTSKSTEKRIYAIVLGVILLGQLLLASRGGIITTAAIFLYSILRSEDVKSKASFVFIIILISFFVYTYASSFVIFERFTEDNMETGGGRTSIWETTLDEYLKQDLSKIIWGGGYSHTVMNLSDGLSTHNNYLEEMFDYGIIGLIIMLVLMVTSFIAGDTAQRMVLLCFLIGFFSLVPLMYLEFWVVFSYLMIPANKKGIVHAN
jgi:hypothetical protein